MASDANISIDYSTIEATAGTMGTKLSDIATELTELKTTVEGLLQNGLVFEQASEALKEAYEFFTTQMETSANNIGEYAKLFQEISTELQNSDSDMANDIRSSLEQSRAEAAEAEANA
ncbi:WXG100 family type VII secretion target [Streptomyces sp. ST2-7A]|uniref:WXG100 family type VII secretion target n=1 Tax=Streptomyces sp. ST2-7A TaxID=2907214 RepID=UPI001F3A9D93|nr:WXG100 family type VII secretion target [Streptomyces sp. ST2-7A]MCE7083488.1 WXG100 family type VII secretion target [Streptomyces sp. ST2-7A]